MESNIEIRDITSIDDIRAVEELQKVVWGIPDIEVVPLTQLTAAIHSGGTLIGAFEAEEAVGFAYGFAGYERGRAVHHSHMLAVKTEYRKHDLGFRLKLAQRDRVLQQGIELMTWTFDPLQSMNAHFNFSKLGVFADTYFADFYGSEATSFLHQTGTDRLWVTWPLAQHRVEEKIEGKNNQSEHPYLKCLVESDKKDRPIVNDQNFFSNGDSIAIEIPFSINELKDRDRSLAIEWRKATREAFVRALESGYIVEDFARGPVKGSPGRYILSKGKLPIGW